MVMDLKASFLKIYANIPLAFRDEIIVLLDNKPLTWNAAYVEVVNGTRVSQDILRKLNELKII
ncbi:hypothetical protein HY993_00445 [Candidatus Micrarchaeota archaeon]|nr:hypothetical protein [Candidatus Micrarchaeota archaeon]